MNDLSGTPDAPGQRDDHDDPVGRLQAAMLEAVKDRVTELVNACVRQDVAAINRIVNDLAGRYRRDGTFAICAALAIVIAHSLGLDLIAEGLPPLGHALVGYQLPRVVLYGDDGYQQRFDAARRFVSLHVSSCDNANYRAVAADDRNLILHGLCESVAAVAPDFTSE